MSLGRGFLSLISRIPGNFTSLFLTIKKATHCVANWPRINTAPYFVTYRTILPTEEELAAELHRERKLLSR